jgi:hypothetical protein
MLALPFFLLPGVADKAEAKCKLVSEDKEKEVKVLILAAGGLETRPEFLRVDKELSVLLSRQLQENFKNNKEKVTLVPTSHVEKYKDEHQNWRALPSAEIGKYFEADYVINLTINSVTLYEPGSANMLFRGNAAISIDVVDVSKGTEGAIYEEEYSIEYPRRGPIPASDSNSNAAQFRLAFLNKMAQELSWRFASHPQEDHMKFD